MVMIFPNPLFRVPIHTASMTFDTTGALSWWERIMTPEHLPWPRFVVGGDLKATDCIERPRNYALPRMQEAATVPGCDSGNWNFRNSPMILVCRYPSVISRRGRASGTKWNIDCFHSSRRIGVVSHYATTRRLLT